MTIPQTFFLSIPTDDETVAYQRYLNIAHHIVTAPDGYNRIVLDGIQYGVFSRNDIVQLSCYNLDTAECNIWEWEMPASWYLKPTGQLSPMKIDSKQFIEEFFEFVEDYKDSE